MNKFFKTFLWIGIILASIYVVLFFILLFVNKGDLKKEILINSDVNNQNPNINSESSNNNAVKNDVVAGFEKNKSYSSSFSPKFGNSDSKMSVIMFIDFDCPFCYQEYEAIRKIMLKYKDSGYFEFRNMPLDTLHPNARILANAAMCANAQNKFWEMFDEMFLNYDSRQLIEDDIGIIKAIYGYGKNIGLNMDSFSVCYDKNNFSKIIDKDFIDGVNYGVNATPTFFINGNKIAGVITYENWEKLFQLSIEKSK